MMTAMAVVGGRVDRSRSTCFTPGGTLLTQSSSFNNMFNTGMVKLQEKERVRTEMLLQFINKVQNRPHTDPFSSTSRSHFIWAATFRASSFRVLFLQLSAGGWTWFCSFNEGLDACSRNWTISCTGRGSVETDLVKKKSFHQSSTLTLHF